MSPEKTLLRRAMAGWRKLPWDWRLLVVLHVIDLLMRIKDLLFFVAGMRSGMEYLALGPFAVRAPLALTYWHAAGGLFAIELLGLLVFPARWVWWFGLAVGSVTTATYMVGVVSGAFHRAAEMSGFPMQVEGMHARATAVCVIGSIFLVGLLVWRILRRQALFRAIEGGTADSGDAH